MLEVMYIVAGLVLLILGGNWLLKAAVDLSLRLQISKAVIGLTVVSFATSAPELIVSINAALEGAADLALGNVVGSNIANLGLVLGVTVLLSPINVGKNFYSIDWPVMLIATLLFMACIYFDGSIGTLDGVAFVVFLMAFIFFVLRTNTSKTTAASIDQEPAVLPLPKSLFFLIIGGLALWFGSELLVNGAKSLATALGVSQRVIGVTVVSVGTSIPELAASIIAVIKKEKAISLGNLIGSNIFNILAVLGITALITPIKLVDKGMLKFDIWFMLAFALILLPLVFMPQKLRLGRLAGAVLVLGYLVFVAFTII